MTTEIPCRCVFVRAERYAHIACRALHQVKAVGFAKPDGSVQRGSVFGPDVGQQSKLHPECRAIDAATKDKCGKTPTHIVTFLDGHRLAVCHDCALYLGQVAGSHGKTIKTEKIA